MWPISWSATVSTSWVLGAAPTFHCTSVSSKCSGLGRLLLITPQPGGKSAWAMMVPTIEWSGSLAGRQSINTSGPAVRSTSVKVKGVAPAHVAKACRTPWNSAAPAMSPVPFSNANVRCGAGHEQVVLNFRPARRSGRPHRGSAIMSRVALSNSPVTGRACPFW